MTLKKQVLVTGSSGYVASHLIPMLDKEHETIGIDLIEGPHTDCSENIAHVDFNDVRWDFLRRNAIVVNLAAIRTDFGAKATDYYEVNVENCRAFLRALSPLKLEMFIHVSSVASFDGRDLTYKPTMNTDDAYRVTKFLQEELVREFCEAQGIKLMVLYPSAIFDRSARSDTNIGKLQTLATKLPLIPKLTVRKTVTYLNHFCNFILESGIKSQSSGCFLTIERPVLTVSEMMSALTQNTKSLVFIPYFYPMLKITARLLFAIGGFGRVDLGLTPNRVEKLFSDTTYDEALALSDGVELYRYEEFVENDLPTVLESI